MENLASDNKNKNILVVDDSHLFRKIIINNIGAAFQEFKFIQATDGLDALEKLKEEKVNLIILDINMPRMTGIEFLKERRKNAEYSQIPIVVLTTEKEKETMGKAYLEGAAVYLNKPFKPEELIKVIKTMVYWHIKG
jgi:two-component system chemotaxis response regulator CheY